MTGEAEKMIKDQAKDMGQNGFMINPRDDLDKPVRIELGDEDDEDGEDSEGNPRGGKNKRKQAEALKNKLKNKADIDTENIYAEDPGKLDMIGNLTSTRLLEINERFEMYPGAVVDCE